jgi:hypothetical protein
MWRSIRNRLAESSFACSMTWCRAQRRISVSSLRDNTVSDTRKVLSIGSSLKCVFRPVLLSIIDCSYLLHFRFVAVAPIFFFSSGPVTFKSSDYRISSCCKAATLRSITGQAGVLSTVNVLTVRTAGCGKDSVPRKLTRSFRR